MKEKRQSLIKIKKYKQFNKLDYNSPNLKDMAYNNLFSKSVSMHGSSLLFTLKKEHLVYDKYKLSIAQTLLKDLKNTTLLKESK